MTINSQILVAPLSVDEGQTLLWEQIASWDMSRERQYMINRLDYDAAHVDEMEVEFKRFMYLIAIYPDKVFPMGERLDDFWHVAVMHTKNYIAFCDTIFGRYIHHNPTLTEQEDVALWPDYLNITLVLYTLHFGEAPEKFWDRTDPKTCCCTN